MRLWTMVENADQENLSTGVAGFPQVFHNHLWTENRLFYKRLGRFCTFAQALFLLLDLNLVLKIISIRKRQRPAANWNIIFENTNETGII